MADKVTLPFGFYMLDAENTAKYLADISYDGTDHRNLWPYREGKTSGILRISGDSIEVIKKTNNHIASVTQSVTGDAKQAILGLANTDHLRYLGPDEKNLEIDGKPVEGHLKIANGTIEGPEALVALSAQQREPKAPSTPRMIFAGSATLVGLGAVFAGFKQKFSTIGAAVATAVTAALAITAAGINKERKEISDDDEAKGVMGVLRDPGSYLDVQKSGIKEIKDFMLGTQGQTR